MAMRSDARGDVLKLWLYAAGSLVLGAWISPLLWGVWGLFLGPHLLMMVKAVCDRIEDLKNIGELLGA